MRISKEDPGQIIALVALVSAHAKELVVGCDEEVAALIWISAHAHHLADEYSMISGHNLIHHLAFKSHRHAVDGGNFYCFRGYQRQSGKLYFITISSRFRAADPGSIRLVLAGIIENEFLIVQNAIVRIPSLIN